MTEETKFREWVAEWMTDSSRHWETPKELDRVMVYCALLGHLFNDYPQEVPIIHCYFTYLLLGVNTWLGTKHEFQYDDTREPLSHEIEVFTPSMRQLAVKVLTPGSEITTGDKHNFLVHLRKVCAAYSSRSKTERHGEFLNLLPLMSWAFGGWNPMTKLKMPDDPCTLRSLIDLYIKLDSMTQTDFKLYYTADTPVCVEKWMVETIDRLYRTCPSIDDIMKQMTYISWFVGVVKARQILRSKARLHEWWEEFADIVSIARMNIVNKLKTIMDAGQEPQGTLKTLEPPTLSKLLKASKWKPKLFQ